MEVTRVVCIVNIILQLSPGVSGWASFKHLTRHKRDWLETIAVKQGLHIERHVAEMRALSRVKRQTSSTCRSGGSGGTGGGGIPDGFGDGTIVLDTVVITAPRNPPLPPLFPPPVVPGISGFGQGLPGFGPIGGGGVPSKPNKPPQTPAPPPKEPPEDKQAKKMTYKQFMYQLKKLEAQLKDTPPDQMAHKLRMLVNGYNSALWKHMLNVNHPIPGVGRDIEGFKPIPGQQAVFMQLRKMMEHSTAGGVEQGVIKVNGEAVALGHVITGATAGYDHQTVLGMDNLFATTISGDLGQSGLQNIKDPSSPIIGPSGTWKGGKYTLTGSSGEATRAEILGDIDGFNIGKRIMADRSKSLSQHFNEYYNGESSRRFDIFKGHVDKATLQREVYRFANLYDYKEAGLLSSALQNSSPDLAVRRAERIDRAATAAVNAFCAAFATKLGSWCN